MDENSKIVGPKWSSQHWNNQDIQFGQYCGNLNNISYLHFIVNQLLNWNLVIKSVSIHHNHIPRKHYRIKAFNTKSLNYKTKSWRWEIILITSGVRFLRKRGTAIQLINLIPSALKAFINLSCCASRKFAMEKYRIKKFIHWIFKTCKSFRDVTQSPHIWWHFEF